MSLKITVAIVGAVRAGASWMPSNSDATYPATSPVTPSGLPVNR
ncbi:MAG: hypothetical protein WBQ08_07430 [Candidatus Sulfotelmatobacter sp.]